MPNARLRTRLRDYHRWLTERKPIERWLKRKRGEEPRRQPIERQLKRQRDLLSWLTNRLQRKPPNVMPRGLMITSLTCPY